MNISNESLKTGGQWIGAATGAGIPAASFFTTLTPPLFPSVSVLTTALSSAILLVAALWRPRSEARTHPIPKSAILGSRFLVIAVVLLIGYVLLLQFTTVTGPEGTRYQIGFGTADWSLTDHGRQWKQSNPAVTAEQLLMYEGLAQDRVSIIWAISSVYVSGSLVILLYFLGFICWTLGFALLAKHRAPSGSAMND